MVSLVLRSPAPLDHWQALLLPTPVAPSAALPRSPPPLRDPSPSLLDLSLNPPAQLPPLLLQGAPLVVPLLQLVSWPLEPLLVSSVVLLLFYKLMDIGNEKAKIVIIRGRVSRPLPKSQPCAYPKW